MWFEGVDWGRLAQDKVHWRNTCFMMTVKAWGSQKGGEFFRQS
jgi:hypothetical protein